MKILGFSRLLPISDESRIEALRKLFTFVGAVSIIIIVVASTWGFSYVYSRNMVKMAEKDAIAVCELMLHFAQERFLKNQNQGSTVVVSRSDAEFLDKAVLQFIDHLNVTKVKIFDRNAHIVYSTDKAIVGKVDADNRGLKSALAGNYDSKLVDKVKTDLKDEKKFTAKVVETYVPILGADGSVVGSFEIYLLVDRYYESNSAALKLTIVIMLTILLITFAVSYMIIGKSVKHVRSAHGLLQLAANTDSLTGVASRSHLFIRGNEELDRVRRASHGDGGGKGLGCIMIDIDRFKAINDNYGHLVGDQILVEFARRIQSVQRLYDVVGRYGGEEFVVLLPETQIDEACRIAARMLDSLRNQPFDTEAGSLVVTASAGVTSSNCDDRALEDMLKRADQSLYDAKRTGRNCFIFS